MIKVLVAEDDAFLSKAYTTKLTKEGFVVIIAQDGEEVIKKVISEQPDIVLLDIVMPKKNGLEVLHDLKQELSTKNIPVIIMSNLGQEEDVKKGKDLGVDDYLIKSDIAINDVVDRIKQVLARSKKKD